VVALFEAFQNFVQDSLPAGIAGSIITALVAIVCLVTGIALLQWARRHFAAEESFFRFAAAYAALFGVLIGP
jgi:putative effector of murein hydrolase LrgA (UPF0299 family)